MPEVAERSKEITPVPPSRMLAQKLERLRRKHVSVAVLTGLAMAVAVAIELLAVAMFVDWWLDLPWGVRLLLLLTQVGVLGYILLKSVFAPIASQPDEDELALMVEKKTPVFRSRLIAAIQLTRSGAIPPGASAVLVDAMVEETEAVAQPIDFNRIVPTDRLRKLGALAAFVIGVGVLGVTSGGRTVNDLLKRAFLSHIPVPRKTRVIVPEGNRTIGRGDNVRLEAYAEGIVPANGKLEVKFRSRRAQEFPLEQDKANRARFGRTIENVQDTFDYTVYLNDGQSQTFTVKAIPRPTVATVECDQEFPAYTKLQAVRRSLGDLSLLAGSKLKLKATATKEIKSASVKLVGPDTEIPMQVNPQNPRELTGEITIPAKGLSGFQIQMLDREGMDSRDSAVYRVDVLPDKPPAVRLTYPDRKEELITRQATMLIGFDAVDDFEIAKVRLKYKVDNVEEGAEKTVELDLGGENLSRVRRRHEWKIGAFTPMLSEGSNIEYWIEVQDNNDTTGPGLGVTDHQLAKVVSESEKRADLLNRAGDYLGTINDVAGDQEKANKNLGTIIREKSGIK